MTPLHSKTSLIRFSQLDIDGRQTKINQLALNEKIRKNDLFLSCSRKAKDMVSYLPIIFVQISFVKLTILYYIKTHLK